MAKDVRTTTRKVEIESGVWRRLGIYKMDGTSVIGNVQSGMDYLAKNNGQYIPVRACENQLMYPIERLKDEDPRAEESRRIAAANGFDLRTGTYRS